MSGELLPCPNPWCEAAERRGDYSPAVRLHHRGAYRVVCTSCVLEGPLRSNEAAAITAWNTRTPSLAADGWQDIDPSPKLGTRALLLKAGEVYSAKYIQSEVMGPVWATPDGHVIFNATKQCPLPSPPAGEK